MTSPSTPHAPLSKDELLSRYETLRRHALDGSSQGAGMGMALILRSGLDAWMETSSAISPVTSSSAASSSASPFAILNPEVVRVLASMAIHLEENRK